MTYRKTFGLIAIGLSVLSIITAIIAYNLLSEYHCYNADWLSHSKYKDGAYFPILGRNITAEEYCVHDQSGVSMTASVIMTVSWTVYFLVVGIWQSDIKHEHYETIVKEQRLCQLHLTEQICNYLWLEQFRFQYADNLGKCDLCPRDAIGRFIKNTNEVVQ